MLGTSDQCRRTRRSKSNFIILDSLNKFRCTRIEHGKQSIHIYRTQLYNEYALYSYTVIIRPFRKDIIMQLYRRPRHVRSTLNKGRLHLNEKTITYFTRLYLSRALLQT